MNVIAIILAAILSSNQSIVNFLGTGAVIERPRSCKQGLVVGTWTLVVMLVTTLITWPINKYLLADLQYLSSFVFVLVTIGVSYLVSLFTNKYLCDCCKNDLFTFAINGLVVGLCLNVCALSFLEAVVTSLCAGVAIIVTIIIYSTLRERINEESVPKAFRGLPISLLVAAMMALAFLAF